MRRSLSVLLILCIVISCKKESSTGRSNGGYLQTVKEGLKDSLTESDFLSLDFSKALLSRSEKEQLHFLRVPIKGQNSVEDFIIVKTNAAGRIESGRRVHINSALRGGPTAQAPFTYNGSITVRSLPSKVLISSPIQNGFITALHLNRTSRSTLKAPEYPDNVMPEVVVVAYVNSGGISYSTWFALSSLFYNSDSGGGGGFGSGLYGSMNDGGSYPGGGGGYGGSSSGNYGTGVGGSVPQEDLLELEAEYVYSLPEIDVWKYFNCFDGVPSAGATYTVKLCVDIPSNKNPDASSAGAGISAGHSFLTITKSNGTDIVTQSFGFYPKYEPSILDPFASVSSAIKDNGGNEYNAAIEMTISGDQFTQLKNIAISRSTLPYNLGSYNCTSYALDVFNAVRTSPIEILPYKVTLPADPGAYGPSAPNTITIDQSPQMLFRKIREMKNSGVANCEIDQSHNTLSPGSHGPCN